MADPTQPAPMRGDDTVTVADGPAAEGRALVGRTLGGFTVVELIGSGGGGDVYRADQPELERSAVIKVLRARTTSGGPRVARFLREAKLASRLDHPYAAHIYAFGAEPDGVLWIAMEHVRGQTLYELVETRGPLPLAVFAPLFERLCEVVRSAHELAIIHRDIKPSNVMIIERAGQWLPKLLDFGIAKDDASDDVGDDLATRPLGHPRLTAHGAIMGTPASMAPEQWNHPEDVDQRTDIYALGVLAYHCITGRPPFVATDRDELARQHISEPPPPLAIGSPQLTVAIHRALAKQPADRWQVATEFGAAVRSAIAGASETLPPLDSELCEQWMRGAPQPIAEAIAQLVAATTTIEADDALHDIVDVSCRWLAALALATQDLPSQPHALRAEVRALTGHADPAGWLALARAAIALGGGPPTIAALVGDSGPIHQLAERYSQPRRSRNPETLRDDVAVFHRALIALAALLDYRIVVGGDRGPESWDGCRTKVRPRVLLWNDSVAVGTVAVIDRADQVVLRLDPWVSTHRPLPHGDRELFVIASIERGVARLAATPWGFEIDDPAAGRQLVRLDHYEPDTVQPESSRSPYPGLAAFARDDADHYFGRERELDAITNRLVGTPRIAVLGASGVGKSSFLHAGLAARATDAVVIAMRPGRDPIGSLAAAIGRAGGQPAAATIGDELARLARCAPRGVLLIIDQFEEVATLATGEARAQLDRLLGDLPTGNELRIVIGVREDFASVIESSAGMRERFEPFVLGAPSEVDLRRALVEPARRAGYRIDDAVVDDIIGEVGGRPGALPLLGFVAARLWQLRDHRSRVITGEAYATTGGVQGAIASYADEVYGSLTRGDQEITRQLFARLVAPDGTRIPLPLSELAQLAGAKAVIARLLDVRLLTAHQAPHGHDSGEWIEPIHECLATRWPRLLRWRSEDAADRALVADLRVAARRWEASGRPDNQLWRGPLVRDAERLVAHRALLESEQRFALASLASERRGRRRRRVLLAALGVAVATVAVVFAYLKRVAERAADEARAAATVADRRLADSLVHHGATELGAGRVSAALAYFGEALRHGIDDRSLRMLIGLAELPWRQQRMSWQAAGGVRRVSFAIDESWFVAASAAGEVKWWTSDGRELGRRSFGEPVAALATAADNRRLLVQLTDRAVIVDARNEAADHTMAIPHDTVRARIGPAADDVTVMTPGAIEVLGFDGKPRRHIAIPAGDATSLANAALTLWMVEVDGAVWLIDLTTGAHQRLHERGASKLTINDARTLVGFIDSEGAVHVIDFTGRTLAVVRADEAASDIELSSEGTIAVYAGRAIHLFDIGGRVVGTIAVNTLSVRRFIVDGDDVWVGGEDGMLRHWHRMRPVAAHTAHLGSIETLGELGHHVITGSSDGALALWDPANAQLAVADELCPGPYVKRTSETRHQCAVIRCDAELGFAIDRSGHGVPLERFDEIVNLAASRAGAVAVLRPDHVELLARDGRVVTRHPVVARRLAFAGNDSVLLSNQRTLLRWSLARDQLTEVIRDVTPGEIHAVTAAAGAAYAGDVEGNLVRVVDGVAAQRVGFGTQVNYVLPSDDDRYLAVKLDDGSAYVLAAADLSRIATLPRGADVDAPPAFDATGDFLVRVSDGGVTLFERATGRPLVTLRELAGELDDPISTGSADNVRVMLGGAPATLRLPPDLRPTSEILRDIACRVPMAVRGVALEEVATRCE